MLMIPLLFTFLGLLFTLMLFAEAEYFAAVFFLLGLLTAMRSWKNAKKRKSYAIYLLILISINLLGLAHLMISHFWQS